LHKLNWLAKVHGSSHRYFWLNTRKVRIEKLCYGEEGIIGIGFTLKVLGNKVCAKIHEGF
jgi:hypothetical protein